MLVDAVRTVNAHDIVVSVFVVILEVVVVDTVVFIVVFIFVVIVVVIIILDVIDIPDLGIDANWRITVVNGSLKYRLPSFRRFC